MDRGVWWATVHGGPEELDMTEKLTLFFLYSNGSRVSLLIRLKLYVGTAFL